MDKAQAIHSFWSQFGTAYDENTVPDDAQFPYITYNVDTGSLEDTIHLHASLWERSTSWENIQKLADRIAEYIGVGGVTIPVDGGYVWIVRGDPFTQRLADDTDNVRRIYLMINVEYLTAN